MNKEEKDNNYWNGYIKKQKESIEICKMCKYRKRYKELKQKETILDKITDKLKQDIKNDYCIKEIIGDAYITTGVEEYSVKPYAQEILNIIEGEKE